MPKTDQFDFTLPIEFLRLGEVLSATSRRTPSRNNQHSQISVDEVEGLVDALLEKIMKNAMAYQRLGLRRGTARDRVRIRIKTVAVLGWQTLRLSADSVEIGNLATSASDPRLHPIESLLRTRHEIGIMAAEDTLIGTSDDENGPIHRARLPFKTLEYLSGGTASMGFLNMGKLVGGLGGLLPDAKSDEDRPAESPKIPTPRQLYDGIRKRVQGLDRQAEIISSRLVMHMTRAKLLRSGGDPGTPNECWLIIGPPGVGKTHICQTACEVASEHGGIVFATADGSDLTAEGYVGMSFSDSVKQVLLASKGDVERARFGFLAIDEFTKKARSMGDSPINTVAVQQEALRVISGQTMLLGGRRAWDKPVQFSTIGTGFALMGHCPGLDRLVEKRMGKRGMGFAMGDGDRRSSAWLTAALLDFGLIEELLSRLTATIIIPPPDRNTLMVSVSAERGILNSYNRLLEEHGSMLFLSPSAIQALTEYGMERGYFRAMKRVVSALAGEAIFDERKGAVLVEAADIRRAAASADGDADELLAKPRLALETFKEECNADDGHGCTMAGG